MKLTFRYYGPSDSIPLPYIHQIPGVESVVTSIYDVKPGEVWPRESLRSLKKLCQENGLSMEVIESIPVAEDIKLGKPTRDHLIDVYAENLRRCAEVGVRCVCYNFMPVFDWIRTDLSHQNPDGSFSLSYEAAELKKMDPKHLHLPGWDESYRADELEGLLSEYQGMSHEKLRENLVYFLNRLSPTLDETGINMAIHPDDPPWDVFGLPRIISSEEDLDALFHAVPNPHNGLTLCVGSLGENPHNDVVHMAGKYAEEKRIFFAHLRNVKWEKGDGSFVESGHQSAMGSLDMGAIVQALVDHGFDGYVRPDHGRNIWGEAGKPGYGLYDRALGCAYISGLFEMAEKNKKQ